MLPLLPLIAVAAAQGDASKLTSEFNRSVAACADRGFDGVIVSLNSGEGARRYLQQRGSTVAQAYLARLSARMGRVGHRRLSGITVQATFATLIDGFVATLDDDVLAMVFNDTREVRSVEANW